MLPKSLITVKPTLRHLSTESKMAVRPKKREENHNTILHIVLREIMQPIDMDCVLANHCFKRWFIFSHHSLFTFLYILPVKYVIFYFLNLHITIACNLTQGKPAQYQNNHANFTVQNTHKHLMLSDETLLCWLHRTKTAPPLCHFKISRQDLLLLSVSTAKCLRELFGWPLSYVRDHFWKTWSVCVCVCGERWMLMCECSGFFLDRVLTVVWPGFVCWCASHIMAF